MIRSLGALLLGLTIVAPLPVAAQESSAAPDGSVPRAAWYFGGEEQPLPPPPVSARSGTASQVGAMPSAIRAPVSEPAIDAARQPSAVGTMSPATAAAGPGSAGQESVMTLPPEDQPETGDPKELPPNLRRQLVAFTTKEPAGTIIIDTGHTYLYLVLGKGKALRYGIGVGREGFTWSGTERISRMKEWPDWYPPAEMIERQPYLPRMMAGGPGNPLGARALYLGHTLYRIHGTNQPSTIGKFVSSGCIRLLNADIEDLFSRVQVGTRVVVLPGGAPTAQNTPADASAAVAQGPNGGARFTPADAVTTSQLPPPPR